MIDLQFRIQIGLLLALLFITVNGYAFEPFRFDADLKQQNLAQFLYYQPDEENNRSIDDILNTSVTSEPWQRNNSQTLNLGFRFHYYWLAIQFHNNDSQAVQKLLEIPYALLDIVDFYEVKNGTVVNHSLQGNLVPFSNRIYKHRYYLYPIKLDNQESTTLYVRVKGSASLQIPIYLWDIFDYWQVDQTRLAIQTVFVGAILIMICYHLFLAWGTREKMYLYYVGILCTSATFMPTYHGIAQQYYWPTITKLNELGASLPVPIANLLITLFAMEILNTATITPKSHKLLKGVVIALACNITISLFLPYYLVMPLITGTILITFTLLLYVCLYSWTRCKPEGRIFISAYSVFLFGSLSLALNKFGAIPANVWTESFVQIGTIIETILLSLAMAFRINRLRRDSVRLIKAEMAAREAQLTAEQEINEGKAKTQFLAMMSHEIRTPMNGVLGLLDILKNTQLDKKQHHLVDNIESSGEMLLTIINDILDFSKADANKLDLESVPTDLKQVITDCSQLYSAGAKQKSLLLLSYASPSLPDEISCDPTRLKQVINNLLGNAFKFTEQGHVLLKAQVIQTNGEHRIRIEVEDTGIGISPSQLSKLFTSFSQADSSTTRKFGGTGLGLAISKKIVEAMGGHIGVESEEGKGSTFWFEIPTSADPKSISSTAKTILLVTDYPRLGELMPEILGDNTISVNTLSFDELNLNLNNKSLSNFDICLLYNESSTIDIDSIAASMSNQAPTATVYTVETHLNRLLDETTAKPYTILTPPVSLNLLYNNKHEGHEVSAVGKQHAVDIPDEVSHLNVLVAEDNQVNQMVIKGILGPLVNSIELVANGQEAVARYQANSERYDLIFMDCEMPVMDGYEATRRIRSLESTNRVEKPITVIALTAHAFDQFKNKAIEAGMDGHLAKPINSKIVIAFLTQFTAKADVVGFADTHSNVAFSAPLKKDLS